MSIFQYESSGLLNKKKRGLFGDLLPPAPTEQSDDLPPIAPQLPQTESIGDTALRLATENLLPPIVPQVQPFLSDTRKQYQAENDLPPIQGDVRQSYNPSVPQLPTFANVGKSAVSKVFPRLEAAPVQQIETPMSPAKQQLFDALQSIRNPETSAVPNEFSGDTRAGYVPPTQNQTGGFISETRQQYQRPFGTYEAPTNAVYPVVPNQTTPVFNPTTANPNDLPPITQQPTTPGVNPTAPNSSLPSVAPRTKAAMDKVQQIKSKEYGFKKFEEGKTVLEPGQTVDKDNYILDADGKKIAGKDRDKDKNWWDSVKSAGIGALVGLMQGGIGGALGGAITGGIGGAVDRNFDEKTLDNFFRLPRAQQDVIAAQAMDKYESDMMTAETNRQDKRDDNQRQIEQFNRRQALTVQLDQQRAQRRRAELEAQATREGNKWKPFYDENGRGWRRYNDGRQEAIPDPDNPGQQDVDPSFKTYQVYSPSGTMVQIRGRDLYQSEMQTERTNTQIANSEGDDDQKYKTALQNYETAQGEYSAKYSANQQKIDGLIDANKKLNEQLAGLDTNTREGFTDAGKIRTQIAANDKEMTTISADNKRIYDEKRAQKPPVKPQPKQRVATPQVVGTYAETEFRRIMKDGGKTSQEIETLVQRGKAQGIIK